MTGSLRGVLRVRKGEGMEITKELMEVLEGYGFADRLKGADVYGNGHINDTILLELKEPEEKVILQRINGKIFPNADELMENISRVTEWIADKISQEGKDTARRVLHIIRTKAGNTYYRGSEGNAYRAYVYIENGLCLEQPRKPEDFYESGMAFGGFQGYLADFPAEKLYSTIPNFHNTSWRFQNLKTAVENDVCGRAKEVQEEIAYAFSKEEMIIDCDSQKKKKNIPLRVTHNDTKLNNAMLDADTERALCVLDLDTVMPGYAMDDFGDSIRFGTNTAVEDEKDLSKVSCDLDLFKVYAEGFLKGTGGRLTEDEIRLFPLGAKMMTYECGIRFLTDYLEGDVYFKTAYPEHNLVRARNQFALVRDMDEKTQQMNEIIIDCMRRWVFEKV